MFNNYELFIEILVYFLIVSETFSETFSGNFRGTFSLNQINILNFKLKESDSLELTCLKLFNSKLNQYNNMLT